MKEIILISPDGGTEVKPHPDRVDYMLSQGWIEKTDKPAAESEPQPETEAEG